MTSDSSDQFGGAFPIVSQAQEPDSYDDLLGVQVPIEDSDLPMVDFQGENTQLWYTPPIANMVSPQASETPIIKKEAPDGPFTSETTVNTIDDAIEISDTEDSDHFYKHSVKMSDGVVILSDKEDPEEIIILDDGSTSVPIKKEDDEVEFLWAKMDDRVIELDSDGEPSASSKPNLGKSFLKELDPKGKRRPVDSSAMRRAQEAFLQAHRRRHGIPEPSADRGVLNGLGLQGPNSSDIPVDDNGSAWMNDVYTPEEGNGSKFRALQKSYKAKIKRDSNTIHDDIEFTKAEKAEKLRLARLKAEYDAARGYSDDENSDDGLFVSCSSAKTSRAKRRAADDPNAEDEDSTSRDPKKRKPNGQGKRSQEDLDEDQLANMLAGIDMFLTKKKFAGEDEVGSSAEQAQGASSKSSKSSKGKKSGSKKSNRKGKGHRNDIGNIMNSNVFDDALANNDRNALPVTSEMDKRKAMKAILACVPLENKQEAQDDRTAILKATVTLAARKITADGQGGWKLQGMASSLHNHQLLAANFIKERECAGQQPLGGILADGMGLGKTLEILAAAVANPPSRGEKYRCTLIVCPPGILGQWEREIKKHLAPGVMPNVLTHHSTSRIRGNGAVATLERADIVLTTYGEVAKSYPKPEVPEDFTTRDQLLKWWEEHWDENRDSLHKAHFYRVVLDEAQAIKNHVTATSIACRALMAKHKWTLSGTPISNRVDELYPYFKFLGIPGTGSFADFVENYCIPGSTDCNKRLHCLLDQVMMRRTHKDSLLGAPILKLPKFNQRAIDLEFNIVEQHIYQLVYRRFVGMLNKASAEGKLEKQPGMGLVAFLRLRQLAAHTFLVQEVLESIFESVRHVDNLERETILNVTPGNKPERELIAALRRMIAAKEKAAKDTPKNPGIFDINAPRLTNLAADFGKYLRDLKTNKKWWQLRLRTVCQRCGEPPVDPLVTDCFHIYCEECLLSMAHDAAAKGHDHTACMQCETIYSKSESCRGLKELEFDEFAILNETKTKNGKVNMEWVSYDDNLVLSTKTTAVRAQVDQWLRDEPDKKIIIFSQFHMIMQILEGICQQQGWKYCTYHGKMSHKAREKTISEFGTDPETKIMIASLRAGGTGLNLTMASKVICIDLWFNNCAEQQAFCRVFRIGQKSETWITRFIVKRSADEKLLEMQLKKNALISAAMDDKNVMSQLTVEEVMRLFGEVRFDKNKKPFIAMDANEKLDSILK